MMEDTKWSAPEGRYTYGGPGSPDWHGAMAEQYDFDGSSTLRFNVLYSPLCAKCGDTHPRAIKCYRAREMRETALAKENTMDLSVWSDTVVEAARREEIGHTLDAKLRAEADAFFGGRPWHVA